MASPRYAKEKGRMAENAVVEFLRANGFPAAERRRLSGANDRGDIAGVPHWLIEVKAGGQKLAIPEWIRQTYTERDNTGDPYPLLVVRPRGVTNPSEFWSLKRLGSEIDLIHLTQSGS